MYNNMTKMAGVMTMLGRHVGKSGVKNTDPEKLQAILRMLARSNGSIPSNVVSKSQYPVSGLKNFFTLGGHGWAQKQRAKQLSDVISSYTQANTGVGRAMRMMQDSDGMLNSKDIARSLIDKVPKGRGMFWRAARRKEFANRLDDTTELRELLNLRGLEGLNKANIARVRMA